MIDIITLLRKNFYAIFQNLLLFLHFV